MTRRLEDIVEELYRRDIKPIPVEEVRGFLGNDDVSLLLKREYDPLVFVDPLRTVKRKPASLILQDALDRGSLKEGRVVVSASSGNFVRELAVKATRLGFRVIAVVPSMTPEEKVEVLLTLGADVVKAEEGHDPYLRETTVFMTRALAERYRSTLTNLDQYNSWLNVLAHLTMTWPEILRQTGGDLDHIVVAIGSVGTLMGLALGQNTSKTAVGLVGVQPPLFHNVPGTKHVVGGCEWAPEIYSPLFGKEVVTIGDEDTYASLVELWQLGYQVGPSTALAATCARRLAGRLKEGRILALSPDSSFSYYDYVAAFLRKHRQEVLERHPNLDEALEKTLVELTRSESLQGRLDRVRAAYRPSREGHLYSFKDMDEEWLSRLIQAG